MIRRQSHERFLLITQHEHALLSGRLASHWGAGRFLRPEPLDETLTAVAMHDCGWPLHDDDPTLNENGQPLDVFENPVSLAVRMWAGAGERLESENRPPYTRLLVSIHVMGLSVFAASRPRDRREIFELQSFQQKEAERQEKLRRELGMRMDQPLRFGLAMRAGDEAEDRLKRNHQLLQAMDRLSLALCCTDPPFDRVEGVTPRAGLSPVTLKFTRTSDESLSVAPWPFDQSRIDLTVPCRAVPAKPFKTLEEFRQACSAAPLEQLSLSVHA